MKPTGSYKRRMVTWYFISLEAVAGCSLMILAIVASPLGFQIAMAAFGLGLASIAVADIDRVRANKEVQESVDRLSEKLNNLSGLNTEEENDNHAQDK